MPDILHFLRRCGGIGIHDALNLRCLTACEFDSHHRHNQTVGIKKRPLSGAPIVAYSQRYGVGMCSVRKRDAQCPAGTTAIPPAVTPSSSLFDSSRGKAALAAASQSSNVNLQA